MNPKIYRCSRCRRTSKPEDGWYIGTIYRMPPLGFQPHDGNETRILLCPGCHTALTEIEGGIFIHPPPTTPPTERGP